MSDTQAESASGPAIDSPLSATPDAPLGDNAAAAAAPVPGAPDANTVMTDPRQHTRGYAWYALSIMVLVYILNFVDRQILSILANDIKRDLGLDDAQIGFLGGAAFGVFYALFGIPLGRLADNWHRIRLMTIGLTLWSAMTVASGFARNFAGLGAARFGVGVGEASASPAAYSLISDYFPKSQRATALAIYSSGLYLGAGLSLFLGGKIAIWWDQAYPDGGMFNLVGWQAAFIIVGLPGLLLALLVWTLKEPVRGISDGIESPTSPHPFKDFFAEMMTVIPPFTLIGAASRGVRSLINNMLFGAVMALGAYIMIRLTGTKNLPQWTAMGLGFYAVYSWATALKERSPVTYRLIWGTPAFIYTALACAITSLTSYAIGFWTPPYVERVFGLDKAQIGLYIGGAAAVGGFLGVIAGGKFADHFKKRNPGGRLLVMMFATLAPVIPLIVALNTSNFMLFTGLFFVMATTTSMAIGGAAATTQDLVLPHMRGAAAATFFLGTTLLGLGMGPYMVGQVSELTGSLKMGMLSLLLLAPICMVLLVLAYRKVPQAEATVEARAAEKT